MVFPSLTAAYASVLALLFAGLSIWVMARRLSANVLHGDGGDAVLLHRARSQANFAEYVPLILIVVGLFEAHGGSRTLVHGLLLVLLVGRVLHPFGMTAPANSPRQYACRGGGILATFAVLIVSALALLLRLS
ncbi:glutathione S-transferase [Methylobacterium indicum]|uniref:Glutathione S-transferase n=1 Tax=Methylobacterium indicum TaxID=1775910 RepID=A0A0J6UDE6_9HYPH|nr:MAPEG family protein [Methylobacterium indicum]KMO13406.1 glutathione S-transferase [Methylobacterium indicum]KMO23781.1 glutathione S-transferase [Methylobacterium indicum]KTS26171.1 glutathione S-transferase [Methylobacterium indicum]KTS39457.1 glutathione S-transferase [Methylobacterium indicum]KTS51297.1 glutathione S-transferase [Methylobacterium indicum]